MKKNYIDEKGNYVNNENLSLAEIFYKGMEEGRKAAEQAGVIADIAVWKNPVNDHAPFDFVVCSKCARVELRKDATEMEYCPGCGRKIVAEMPKEVDYNELAKTETAEYWEEARRESHSLDDGDNCLAYKGG